MNNIKFTTKPYGQDGFYGVEYESLTENEKTLFEINSHTWTPEIIQQLIDDSLALQGEEELEYKAMGSNLFMIIDKDEVYFYNSLENKQEEDFIWSLEKFIQFLEDFKLFVSDN